MGWTMFQINLYLIISKSNDGVETAITSGRGAYSQRLIIFLKPNRNGLRFNKNDQSTRIMCWSARMKIRGPQNNIEQ